MKTYFFIFLLLTTFLFSKSDEHINKDGNTLLHKLVLKKDISGIEKLLNEDVEIDQKNYKGETPLHLAVKVNSFAITKMLIEHYATISIYDVYNFSPLYYANNLKYFELANLLKRHGAKVDRKAVNHKIELENFMTEFNCEK